LKIKCNFTTYQSQAEQIALIDSGAMESFIEHQTVAKLRLRVTKIPQPQKIYNVDGMENQAGLIKHCIHLYVKHGGRQK